MAAALHELVTVDTTFGKGHRFTTLIVQDSLDPAAGSGHASGAVRALTEGERFAIEARLATVGPVQWTDNPDDWRTPDLVAVVEGSAIIGVGEPVFDDEGALVPVSLWCGGVCGTWFSYRAIETDSGWEAVGPEGPVAVS